MAKLILADLGITAQEIASGAFLSVSGYAKAIANVATTPITNDTAVPINYLMTEVKLKIEYYSGGGEVPEVFLTSHLGNISPGFKDIVKEHYLYVENAAIPAAATSFDIYADYKFASVDPGVILERIQINRGSKAHPYSGSTASDTAGLSILVDPGGTGSSTGLEDLIRWSAGTRYNAVVSKGTAAPTGGTEGDIYYQTDQADQFKLNNLGDVTAGIPTVGDVVYADSTSTYTIASIPTILGYIPYEEGTPLTATTINGTVITGTSLVSTGNITVTGTVDGVDIAAEETRLANTSGTNTGDSQTLAAGVSDVTATAAELNLLDLAGLTEDWILSADTATTASWKAPSGGGGSIATLTDVDPSIDPAQGDVLSFSADSTLTGSIDPTASTAVVGVGTLFLTELEVGDKISVSTEIREVATITDDLNLTVTEAFTDVANDTAPQKIGEWVSTAATVTGADDLIKWTDGTNYNAIISKGTDAPTGGTEGDIYFQITEGGNTAVDIALNDLSDVTAGVPVVGDIVYADTTSTYAIANSATVLGVDVVAEEVRLANTSGTNTGDSQTLAAGVSDVTATAAELNLLDPAGLTADWVLSADTATTASWKAQTGSGSALNDLTDVTAGTPVVGDLVYADTTSTYAIASLDTILGYTPYEESTPLTATTINGTTITGTGVVTGLSFNATSDLRKKNLKDTYSLTTASEIKTHNYEWKEGSVNQIGYIAQEVELVIPEAVLDDEDGFKSVNYSMVHTAKIAELETKVLMLERLLREVLENK